MQCLERPRNRAKWLKHLNKHAAGFTILEMMMVVAVIAVLTAIAIPTFQGYQSRSRQAEAKTALGSMFSAEAGFYLDQQHYSGCLGAIGYSPQAESTYYATGLGDAFSGQAAPFPGFGENIAQCPAPCGLKLAYSSSDPVSVGKCNTSLSNQAYFTASNSADSTFTPADNNALDTIQGNVINPTTGLPTAWVGGLITKNYFQVSAVGFVGFGVPDYWTMDQNKSLVYMGLGVACSGGSYAFAGADCP